MAQAKVAAKAAPKVTKSPAAPAAAPKAAAVPAAQPQTNPDPDLVAVGGKPPKAAKPPKVERPTCSATKKDGTPCTSKCKEGQATCVDHMPVILRLNEQQRELWDLWVGNQSSESLADMLGWHKVRDLIGDPVPGTKATVTVAA